jgi:hypothetical protein
MSGPNNVAYREPFQMYHAGGTTVDFATGNLYSPIGKVGGQTNSTGSYASVGTFSKPVLKVQPDGMTPNAFLNTAAGIDASSSGTNTARSYTHNGLSSFGSKKSKKKSISKKSKKSISKKKRKFGSQIYSPLSIARGSGSVTLSQPLPPYMDKGRDHVKGDYVSKFGSKPKESSSKKDSKKPKSVSKNQIIGGHKRGSIKKDSKKPKSGSKNIIGCKGTNKIGSTKKPKDYSGKTITLKSDGKITIG